jgi:hypothetical protein
MGSERQEYGNSRCALRHFETEGRAPVFRVMYDWEFERYTPENYRSGGLFREASHPVRFMRFEAVVTFNPFNGQMYHLISDDNPSASVFSDYETAFDLLDAQDRIALSNLANFETVNMHQWEGINPIEHRVPHGVTWREGPAWDIATSDLSLGTRRLMLRGHVTRDYAFMIQQRLQAVASYTQRLIEGWEDLALSYDKIGAQDPEDLEDDCRAEGEKFAEVINSKIKENPPNWAWLER